MKQPAPRIISGSAKNTRLRVPKKGTRPMMDRVKSALFSIIFQKIPNASVLDLYAGTGALGIECLSRGAKYAVFVDRAKDAIAAVDENLNKTGFEALATVIKASTYRFLSEPEKFNLSTDSFDIIFVSPPHAEYKEQMVELAGNILKKDGILIAEHPITHKTQDRVGELEKIDEREYGKTGLSFYMQK